MCCSQENKLSRTKLKPAELERETYYKVFDSGVESKVLSDEDKTQRGMDSTNGRKEGGRPFNEDSNKKQKSKPAQHKDHSMSNTVVQTAPACLTRNNVSV